MAAVNESDAETTGDKVTTTGQIKARDAEDEEAASTSQRKTKTARNRKVVSPADISESPTKSLPPPPTNIGERKLTGAPRTATREATNRRDQSDIATPRRPCWKFVIWGGGVLCCLVTIVSIFWAVLTISRASCNTDEDALCTSNNATCSKSWFTSTCTCNIVGQDFHMRSCQYKCDYDPQGFCPNGICHKAHCFRDVFAFVTFVYNESCKETATYPVCSVTCAEIVKYVCAHNTSNPPFCSDSKPTTLTDFSCQRDKVSKGFIGLTSDGEKECVKDQQCKRLMTLYPCLAGYVNRGSVFCSKKCVVPKNRAGEPLFFNGYCFLKNANCDGAVTKLMEMLNESEIGYPYTTDSFRKHKAWSLSNINRSPNLPRLLYPLMLAYGVLGEEGKVSIKNDAPQEVSEFMITLNNSDAQDLLNSLYTGTPNIVEDLMERVKKKMNAWVYEDRFLRVAYLVIHHQCRAFNKCPTIPGGTTETWAREGGMYCSLSKALFITNLTVNARWCESIARLQGATELSTKSFSFIYSPSFVSHLISQTSYVNGARKLENDVFKRSRALCDIEENLNNVNRSNIIIPMALSDALGWVKNERTKPKRISGFALILANAVSVRITICNEEDDVPSIDCELRLYLAFLAFLPDPCKEEQDLVASEDKAVVYFTLRAAMRRQLSRGSEILHINKNQTFPANSKKIAEAAQQLVTQCLERIPN